MTNLLGPAGLLLLLELFIFALWCYFLYTVGLSKESKPKSKKFEIKLPHENYPFED